MIFVLASRADVQMLQHVSQLLRPTVRVATARETEQHYILHSMLCHLMSVLCAHEEHDGTLSRVEPPTTAG